MLPHILPGSEKPQVENKVGRKAIINDLHYGIARGKKRVTAIGSFLKGLLLCLFRFN